MATPPDFKEITKMVQQMQDSMEKIQKDLETQIVSGKAGGGMIEVKINGKHSCKKVIIDQEAFEEALDEGKEFLEDLLVAAINDALKKVEDISKKSVMDLSKQFEKPKDDAA